MTQVRVDSFTISLDGYGAGPNQGVENPLGVGGEALHDWLVATRSWRRMHGMEGGTSGVDDDFAARRTQHGGAWPGSGERLFEGLDLSALGYECVQFATSDKAAHVVLRHVRP